jgi:polysaccharide biosynthesis protein PelA
LYEWDDVRVLKSAWNFTLRRRAIIQCAALCLFGEAGLAAAGDRWVVCYSPGADARELAAYDIAVLDADHHPPLAPLVEGGKTRLAYLSLTQIGKGRAEFAQLVAAGVLFEQHPVWTDAHYLDFRRPEWSSLVLDVLVPRALDQGFDGIFLDTLDDAEYLERLDPVRYQGMRAAAVRLVRSIRRQHPRAVLMVNRGYALMPELAGSIDVLMGESVVGTFDTGTKAYRRQSPSDIEWQVNELEKARTLNPRLRIFTLDYWDPADRDGVRAIYREQRARGFAPYVSTPQLDTVIAEPR